MILNFSELLREPGAVKLDVRHCPDLVPALAVQAALRAGQTTRIVNAARLRMKESDRLQAVAASLNALGHRYRSNRTPCRLWASAGCAAAQWRASMITGLP